MRFATKSIHVGEIPGEDGHGSMDVVVPIHLASTFARNKIEELPYGYEYSRTENPTRRALEAKLAALEGGKYGLAFSSGMSSISSVLMSFVKPGETIIAFDDLYSGTKRIMNYFSNTYGINIDYIDARVTENVLKAIKRNDRISLIWMETPTNPLLKICDIKAIAELSKSVSIPFVVDNTFLSPVFQNPLEKGADIVVHSTTKYINGHSDSVGGALITSNEEYYEKLKYIQNAAGTGLSPFDSYMVLRGIKTLHLRMQKHQENALALSQYLASRNEIRKVYYPGLPCHSQHTFAKENMKGYGGIVTVDFTNSGTARKFVERLKLFHLAESLGGVESLVEIPSLMTHSSISVKERDLAGIRDSLVRLSVGIEDPIDLIADVEQALEE